MGAARCHRPAPARPATGTGMAAGAAAHVRPRHPGRLHRHQHDPDRVVRARANGAAMKLEAIELRRIALPLVAPFRTSFGTQTDRDILLVRAMTPDGEGWAECVALSEPTYSPEYVDMAQHVIRRFLVPALPADVTGI